jgi:hypothetical protein
MADTSVTEDGLVAVADELKLDVVHKYADGVLGSRLALSSKEAKATAAILDVFLGRDIRAQ